VSTGDIFVRHLFGGGYATDLGPSWDGAPQGGGFGAAQIVIPYLTTADNVMFDLDGGPTKSPGTVKINATALESGAQIRGCYDYWIQGAIGAPTQKRVIHVGTKIKADAADGNFSDIATGVSSSGVPSYATFNDTLIISDDQNTAPKKWTGTGSASALGGSPPNFAFCIEHKGRLFAAGNPALPSTLYYSDSFDHEDWAGGGNILIGTNDGSGITGLASYKDALVIFKGPKKGSIHVLSGNSPSDFQLATLRRDCGAAVCQSAIFPYQDDLGFVAADGSIQRLSATAAFGSFQLGHLSRDIAKYIDNNIVRTQLKRLRAVNWESRGILLFTIPVNASSFCNAILMLDYRFGDSPRFSPWPAYAGACNSACLATDESDNSKQTVLIGGNDGYLRKLTTGALSIDETTAIAANIRTPNLSYGAPHLKKTYVGGSLGFLPLTDDTVDLTWYRDDGTSGTLAVEQGGGDLLTPTTGSPFTLDTSVLSGGQFVDRWFDHVDGGEFRSIAYQIQNADLTGNFSLHSLSSLIRGGAFSLENFS
jgi:hypothetical protein